MIVVYKGDKMIEKEQQPNNYDIILGIVLEMHKAKVDSHIVLEIALAAVEYEYAFYLMENWLEFKDDEDAVKVVLEDIDNFLSGI